MGDSKKKDWRSLPRKPAATKRSVNRGLKLTATEAATLRANASAAGMTIVDYIVARCCSPAWRRASSG